MRGDWLDGFGDCALVSGLCRRGTAEPITYRTGRGARPCMLQGTATYRLPHHPRYKDSFANPLYKPIWFKAFGMSRYTYLCCVMRIVCAGRW